MKSFKVGSQHSWLVIVGLLAFVMAVAWPLAAHADGRGVTIKINAQNRSTTDTPFCGVGGGLKGDKLQLNVFTDLSGVTTGTATFKDANHVTTTLNIDTVFGWDGAIVLMDSNNSNVVAIWYSNDVAPAHVSVEIPRGCENTKSTFTLGVDTVSLQIKF
jgi:hypothetical protein